MLSSMGMSFCGNENVNYNFARLGTSCMSAIGSVVGLLGPRNRNRKDRPAGPAKYAI